MTDETERAGLHDRFADLPDQYDPNDVEERVLAYWDAVDAYERTVEHRSNGEDFFLVDGPSYSFGSAHMAAAWNKTLKDCYVRYLRMRGYDVTDRPGYEMHGLPIETRVQKRRGLENKADIEEFGKDSFVTECKAYAEERLDELQADFRNFGVWMDWEDPYKTISPSYMEATWWALSQAHERGLVEQGMRSIDQCPRCETAIENANHYENEKQLMYVSFPLTDREGSLVVWTTAPWTIVDNTFVAVDPNVEYVGVDAGHVGETDRLYVADSCLDRVLTAGGYEDYEVVERLSGEDLVRWSYDHPLHEQVPDHVDSEGSGQVYTADYVEADRTGFVHSAPGHAKEAFERGRELDLELFCPVAPDGSFTDAGGEYAGQFVRDASDDVVSDLDAAGCLLGSEVDSTVRGRQCWRCGTDTVRIVIDQWFVTISDVRSDLLDLVGDSRWYPDWARDNQFRRVHVVEASDWNVSKRRYWGIPIPIWLPSETADGESVEWSGEMDDAIVIADREELAARVDREIDPETVDLHRDTVDELTITEDGVVHERVPDVFDVWFSSSVATLGTVDFPEQTDGFEQLWPADLVVEAYHQSKGWIWAQLMLAGTALGELPYRQVLMHGYANMPDGRRMSKSEGVLVDPREVIDEHGRDPMRLFLLSVTARAEDMDFSWEETAEMERRLDTLWDVARFALPHMDADGFDPETTDIGSVADDLELADEWVLSQLRSTTAQVTDHMDDFENARAVDALLEFVVEDVSRLYIPAVGERVQASGSSRSKRAAYATLYEVLASVAALLAPFAPFLADSVYAALTGDAGHPTVHMCDWPDDDSLDIDR